MQECLHIITQIGDGMNLMRFNSLTIPMIKACISRSHYMQHMDAFRDPYD